MLASRLRLLTHVAARQPSIPSPLSPISIPFTWTPSRNQCRPTSRMSPDRLVATSPEGTKRRRLTGPSRSASPQQGFSTMSPLLVQEVEEEVEGPTEIKLIPVEEVLYRLLVDVTNYIDTTKPLPGSKASQVELPSHLKDAPLVLRFAGGWVRDKLLGVQSHDIDVAINKMTGEHFGLRLKEYLEVPGNLNKYALDSIAQDDKQSQQATTDKSRVVGGLHTIKVNPDKSKNLETTTLKMFGLDVDLVNLRKEVYSDDSRNPQIEFGTPEEDALRRDATVNSLFYNLITREVEDFTGRGIEDMKNQIMRTPLEPYQTFKDDPLRVLRLIRFASRLGYTIDPAALEAMKNADIKEALRRKISRERIGIEMDKSLQGPDPREALRLVFELDLYETIYSDPAVANADHYQPDLEGWETVIGTLHDILCDGDVIQYNLAPGKEEQFLAWQLAALIPYRDAPLPEPTEPGKKPPPPIAVTVAKDGVKAPNKTSDVVFASVRNQSEISNMVDQVYQKKRWPEKKWENEDPCARDILGMALRRWGFSWRSQVMYSLLVEIANIGEKSKSQIETMRQKYLAFLEQLIRLDLLDVCNAKPLLDGKQLAKAIGMKPGPWMKDALDVVMAWQLRNPDVKDPEQAIEEVKKHQANGELTSDLVRHFLKLTIRPSFIKATPSSVTNQGRRVTTEQLPKKFTMDDQDEATKKPWKNARDAYVLDILRWSVESLNHKIIGDVWPLVIPPILTLLDDWETKYKLIGARLLDTLLQRTPSTTLSKTGLGEVFEDALFPCLTYLPTLTPENEAKALLSTVYPALLTLCSIRFQVPPPVLTPFPTLEPLTQTSRLRIKYLDKIIRKGFLYDYENCTTYPEILMVLFTNLPLYLNNLGLESVKHLKYIIPMLTDTLSHPLGKASLHMLQSAVDALQAVIRNAWPRMVEWRGEILKGVCLCWLNNNQEEEGETLRGKLRGTVELLDLVMEERSECDFEEDCRALVAADPRLKQLFEVVVGKTPTLAA